MHKVLLTSTALIGGAFTLAMLTSSGSAQTAPQPARAQSAPTRPAQQAPTNATSSRAYNSAEFGGVEVCIQNDNYTGSVWHPAVCIDMAPLSVDQAYAYTSAIHVDKPLFDTNVPTVRLGGVMPNGSRIWLVNFSHAATTARADDIHPLRCTDDGDAYRCQWYTTANAREWSDYKNLQLENVTNVPNFFIVSKTLMSREVLDATLAKEREESLTAGRAASNETADWYYKDDNEDGAECHKLSGTPKQLADTAVRRGATELETAGNDVLRADVVISYSLKGQDYSYSFYKSHEKCSNPFGAADDTRPDFSRIGHDVDSEQDKKDRALADEALRHAADKGPWWVFDGTKTDPACIRSKVTPMQDAQDAKAHGARNVQIRGGLMASNVPHPHDVVVEYDLNGKSFYDDYVKNKECNESIE